MPNRDKNTIPIYVISGGKGVAGHTMVHSILIQYPNSNIPVRVIPEVQTDKRIEEAVLKVKKNNGILTHTMVNSTLRKKLIEACKKHDVKEIDFMGPLANFLDNELKLISVSTPGLYQRTNALYFDRIAAIEYTMNHDDGLNTKNIKDADIILVGLSRSGKTPLSVYMSMFGWKVANVPLVEGIAPPDDLFKVDPLRVFGLAIGESNLIAQRHKRLIQIGNMDNIKYVDNNLVKKEIRYANFIFEKGNFTKINVNNKPIETSANEIIGLISERFQHDSKKIRNQGI
ncbi:pyruvate, water dikinase regulatory protein [Bacteroidota bacterium]